ncbi:acetyl-CoA synthetase-like protein [Melanomma pulvis-pyrius CBS 109.77]|uniref:Acetyl-CoA synthetase-like protein n=1 Tax=Melanomma pulvis-pyrius CBS 109.77 TaxID=1314802 RepID=A0A6A6XCR4_9PLEO|nr:acetyl-CoA synthetase-like protein [Melanomma pulvis-pyrius CBS 109.77]
MAESLLKRPVLQPQIVTRSPYTVEAPDAPKVDGETIPRRHPSAKHKLVEQPEPGVATVYDVLRRSARKFGKASALGSRKALHTHTETKQVQDGQGGIIEKKWTYYELSDYTYISFLDLEQRALRTGAAMRKLGVQQNDRIEIYAATSAFWFTVAHGASSQSITIVTAYDTLGEEGLSHSLKQTSAKAIFVDPALLPRVIKALEDAKDVLSIIYNEDNAQSIEPKHVDALTKKCPHVSLYSFSEFLATAVEAADPVPPSADDLACIMYTSGSTGAPKGVLLKHRNVIAALAGVNAVIEQHMAPGERLLAYLPLAHIIEFVFENAALYWGGVMGYGNPRTLTDQSVRKCLGDIRAFKPSVMVGVPAVWESVKKGVVNKVGASGSLKSNLFWGAMAAKQSLIYWGLPGAKVLDYLVFNKIKEATGGNLRVVLNGGGAIAEGTLRFISFAICPMLNGYGLTETAGMGAINDPLAWTSANIGCVPASVEVKLVDVPELNYLTSDDPPTGEIWIRGAAVIDGYLDNPEENAKAFQDGWFKTGDIGLFDDTGSLKIIDRKKNLVKTLNGEYIALEKLESLYRSAPIVNNICVYASPDHAKPVAVVQPAPSALRKIAKQLGEGDASHEALCNSDKVRAAVRTEVQMAGKQSGLQGIELVHDVVLSEEEWTPQNGLVTNAQKLNRRAVVERFKKQIDSVYQAGGA